jgi:hypothetical protein
MSGKNSSIQVRNMMRGREAEFDEVIGELVRKMLNDSAVPQPGDMDEHVANAIKIEITKSHAMPANRQQFRNMPKPSPGDLWFIEKVFDKIVFELSIKFSRLLRDKQATGQEPSEDDIRSALGNIGRILVNVKKQTDAPPDPGKSAAAEKAFERMAPLVLKLAPIIIKISSLSSNFTSTRTFLNKCEDMLGKAPLEIFRSLVMQEGYASSQKPELLAYATEKLPAFVKISPDFTCDVVDSIVTNSMNFPAEIRSLNMSLRLPALIQTAAEQIPVLFNSTSTGTNKLMDSLSLHADWIAEQLSRAPDHDSYRVPAAANISGLVDLHSGRAKQLLDMLMPEDEPISQPMAKAIIGQLATINMRSDELASKLFVRLSRIEDLPAEEVGLLRTGGLAIFAKNTSQDIDRVVEVWQRLLALPSDDPRRVPQLVDDAFPAAQAAFPQNASFALRFLAAIDEAMGGITQLQLGITGREMLTRQSPAGYAVVTANNRVAVVSRTGERKVDTVAGLLSGYLQTNGSDIAKVRPMFDFMIEAQDILRTEGPASNRPALGARKRVVVGTLDTALPPPGVRAPV